MKTSQKCLMIVAAVCGLTIGQIAGAAVLTSYYTFDGNTLNSVAGEPDGTRQGPGGANNLPQFVSGAPGGLSPSGALNFDGSDDYVDTTTLGRPLGSDLYSGSVAFWIKTTTTADSIVIGDFNGATGFELEINGAPTGGTGDLRGFVRNQDFTWLDFDLTAENQTWRDGNWHLLAFTWNFTNATAAIYVDAVPQALNLTAPTGTGGFNAWNASMPIGAQQEGGANHLFFNGSLDDFRVYQGELTQGELNSLFAVPEPSAFLLLGLGGLIAWRRKRME